MLVYGNPDSSLVFRISAAPDRTSYGLHDFVNSEHIQSECYNIYSDATVTHPEASDTRIGTFPLHEFLVTVGAQTQLASTRAP